MDKNGQDLADLPAGWMRCDGSEITDKNSIWHGHYVPDLNGDKRFLRGGSENDMLTEEEDQMQNHRHTSTAKVTIHDPGHHHSYDDNTVDDRSSGFKYGDGMMRQDHTRTSGSSHTGITASATVTNSLVSNSYRTGVETRPKNMIIIWVIRVW